MSVTIDSLEKLRLANEVLASGRGTPEERAEIQMAMEKAKPAIDFAVEWRNTGSFRSGQFFDLDESNQIIVNDFMRQEGKKESAKTRAGMLEFAGGMGRCATEVGQNAAELIGFDAGASFLSEHAENITDATTNLSRSILEKGFGRRLTEEEAASHRESVEGTMKAGEVTEKVALSFAPGKFLGMAKGFWTGLGLGAAEGVGTGLLTADIDQDMTAEERAEARADGATWGAIFGAPMGALTGAYASVRNLIAREVANTADQADDAFRIADEFDVPITLGQATGSPSIQAAEQAAASSAAQKFLAEQGEQLAPAVATKLQVALPRIDNIGAELPSRVKDAFGVLDDVISDIKQVRQSAWQSAGRRAVEVGGDTPIMGVNNLQGKMQDIMEQVNTRFGGAAEMGDNFRTLFNEVQSAARGGGATAKQVSDWWLRINTMAEAGGTSGFIKSADNISDIAGPQVDALAGQLARTMRASIDEAADSPAMALLKAQRGAWSDGTKALQEINDNVLQQLGLQGSVNGERVLKALDNIDVSKMQSAMEFIRRQPGGNLKVREIQGALFESAAQQGLRAGVRTPGQSGAMDVTAFTEALASTTRRSRLAGVLTEGQEQTARRGIELARTILNEGAQQSNRVLHRIVTGAENIAINVVSRDPGFLARLTAGAIVRGKGADWLFYSEEGLNILRSIHPQYIQFGRTTQARQAAIALITNMLADGAKEEQEREINAEVGNQQ